MMKKIVGAAVCLLALMATACSTPDSCLISGSVDEPALEGMTVYLEDPFTHALEDSTVISQGKFEFQPIQPQAGQPQLKRLKLCTADKFLIDLLLPVALEKGKVKTQMGNIQSVAGPNMNARIGQFLLDLDDTAYRMTSAETDEQKQQVRLAMGEFLVSQIRQNNDNALGAYILLNYGDRIPQEDYKVLEQELAPVLKELHKK